MSDIKNYLPVSDRIACAGQPDESQLASIAAEGFEVVINLGLSDGKYALADESASLTKFGLTYHHIPVVFDRPEFAQWESFYSLMNRHRSQKTFVHCAANYRASAFTGLYLFATSQLREEELFAFISRIWQPDTVWQQFIGDAVKQVKDRSFLIH